MLKVEYLASSERFDFPAVCEDLFDMNKFL